MRPFLSFPLAALFFAGFARAASPIPALPRPEEVLAAMERVADWQITHPPVAEKKEPADGWVQAAGDTGIMALANLSAQPRFFEAMRRVGEKNGWKPGPRVFHADDHCIVQTYAELYLRDHKPEMIAPATERFDYILAHPVPGDLEFVGENRSLKWSWCDALFMAPPAWLRMWKATGKAEYLEFAVSHWWKTSDYLYDPSEQLYFRDSTYFRKREANGKKVFWGRGNGWVFGGLARMMQLLPADHPSRAKFEQQFKEMASRLIALQQADGFWRASLLDPESYPAKEASGTGFFCFGLAWGINQGLLDRETYLPAVLKAWTALNGCVEADGKLVHVQPIGADPKRFDPESTEPYGVGAFLLAGVEVHRLGSAR